MQPIEDKVCVKKTNDNKPKGILLSAEISDSCKTPIYEVVSIGDQVNNYVPDLKVGDKIIINRKSETFTHRDIDGDEVTEYYIIRAMDILAICEDEVND